MISEHYRLLGLIVNTVPFAYQDNVVSANYSGYVEVADLESLRIDLETQLSSTTDDIEQRKLNDDILFIRTMIENLTRAS